MLIQLVIAESPSVAKPLQMGKNLGKKKKKNNSITKSKSAPQSTASYIHVLIGRLIKMGYESRRNLLLKLILFLSGNVNKRKREGAISRQVLFSVNDANQ